VAAGTPPLTPAQRQAIANERLKLFAQALDRAATGSLVVGVLGPLASPAPFGVPASFAWLAGAVALHFGAQAALGKLR
jgi:hypothetical protein